METLVLFSLSEWKLEYKVPPETMWIGALHERKKKQASLVDKFNSVAHIFVPFSLAF